MATEAHIVEIVFTDTTDRRTPGGGGQFGQVGAPYRATAFHKVDVAAAPGVNTAALALGTRYLLVTSDTAIKLTFGTWNATTGAAVDPTAPDATSGGVGISANVPTLVIVPVPPKPTPGLATPAGATAGIKVNICALVGTEAHISEVVLTDPGRPLPYGGAQFGHVSAPVLPITNHFADISNGDGTLTAAIALGTRHIRVWSDANCKVTFGTWDAAGAPQDPAVGTATSAGITVIANKPVLLTMPNPPGNASGGIKVRVRNYAA